MSGINLSMLLSICFSPVYRYRLLIFSQSCEKEIALISANLMFHRKVIRYNNKYDQGWSPAAGLLQRFMTLVIS